MFGLVSDIAPTSQTRDLSRCSPDAESSNLPTAQHQSDHLEDDEDDDEFLWASHFETDKIDNPQSVSKPFSIETVPTV